MTILARVLFCGPNPQREPVDRSERRSPTCEDDVGDVVSRLSAAVVLVLVVEELLVPGVLHVEGALAVGGRLVLVRGAAAQAAVVQRETVALAVGHELSRGEQVGHGSEPCGVKTLDQTKIQDLADYLGRPVVLSGGAAPEGGALILPAALPLCRRENESDAAFYDSETAKM